MSYSELLERINNLQDRIREGYQLNTSSRNKEPIGEDLVDILDIMKQLVEKLA